MDPDQLHGQPIHPSHVGQKAGRHLPLARRRVQLPQGFRPLLPGEVSLQSRTQRALLQAEDVLHGVRHQTLRWTGWNLQQLNDYL